MSVGETGKLRFDYRMTEIDPMIFHAPTESASLHTLRQRVHWLKWLLPAMLLLVVIVYEIGPSRWINNDLGSLYHALSEILIYGTVGPLLAFVLLDFWNRWLEERETSETQSQILARARAQAADHTQLSDDV